MSCTVEGHVSRTDLPYVVLFANYNFWALSPKYTLPPLTTYEGFFSWALGLKPAT